MTDEEFWDSFECNLDLFRWPEEHPLDRFYRRIQIKSDGCWEWIGAKTSLGYGVFCVGYKSGQESLFAHRFMLTLVNGKVHNQDVHHKCGNRSCVRPYHLEDLSKKDHASRHPRTDQNTTPPGSCCIENHYGHGLCKFHYDRIYYRVKARRACWLKAPQECAA